MKQNKNEVASIKTTNNLVAVARKHFSLYGYSNTSLESIVEEVGMTRGALYHHYRNKKSLFLAVLTQVQKEVGANVEKEAMTTEDAWQQLILGSVGFVEAAVLESNRKILLIDAPNVVDWDEWRKIDNANSASLLEEQLYVVKKEGLLVELNISFISHMISGALNELSLYLAETDTIQREEVYELVTHLIEGFKKNG